MGEYDGDEARGRESHSVESELEERVRCAYQVLKELDDYIGKDQGW